LKKSVLIILGLLIGTLILGYLIFNGKSTTDNARSLISLCSDAPKTRDVDRGIFTPEKDIDVLEITLDMEKNKVEKTFGEPVRIEKVHEDAFVEDVLYYYYKFGVIRLEPLDADTYTVSRIEINKPKYKGPRDIEVGDNINDVIQKFPNNKNAKIDEDGKKYLYGKLGDENYGYALYDKAGEVSSVIYVYGGGGFGSYRLIFKAHKDVVTEIFINVCNI
jgi:hypothetical protein